MSSSLPVSAAPAIGLTLAIAVILLASNFTIINAQQQQQLTSQAGELGNGITAALTTTTPPRFQSVNDSFSVEVPDGWVIHDVNNTGSALLEESTQGYGILAQLCPEEEEQQQGAAFSTNASGSTNNTSSTNECQGAQQELVHIVRYPDLDTRIRATNNATTSNNNITTDNILSYHLQKLQEVGYRSIQIINSTDMTLNLTSPQTNETIATAPAKLVEMKYSTNSAPPNETRIGYFILTATNVTAHNLGTTKGYAVFYEGNSTNSTTVAEITAVTAASSGSLAPTPLPPVVEQVFDSFELIAAPEVAQTMAQEEPQAAEFAEGSAVDDGAGAGDDDDEDDGADDDGAGAGDDDDEDDGADDDGGGDDDGADDDGGGDDDGPDRCISVGGRSTSVTDC
jgi:hypothetical protein